MNSTLKTIVAVILFSVAMAALESAVVVYLRELYYPSGFTVAFKMIDQRILMTELVRELATLIMLIAIGYLCGKNFKDRIAYFLLSFAVWDLFYYVWLKVFIDWPSSMLEWDILFLLPFTWLGPVLAPVICSITMVILAIAILRNNSAPSFNVWSLFLAGSAIILFTFLKDYGAIIINNGFVQDYFALIQNKNFLAIASRYVPQSYSWGLFILGEILIIAGIILLERNHRSLSEIAEYQ